MMTDVDPAWEYNAPQFVDFSTPAILDIDDAADKYFDVDHENGGVELIFEEEDSSLYEDAPPTTPAPTLNKATPGLTPSRATPKRVAVTAKPRTPLSAKRVTPLRTRQRTLSAKSTPKVQSPKVPTPHTRSRSVSNTPKTPADEPPENDKENVDVSSSVEKRLRAPKNLCTSLSAWRKTTTKKATQQQQQPRKRTPGEKKALLKNRRSNPTVENKVDQGKSPVIKKQRRVSPERKKLSLEVDKPSGPVTRTRQRTQSVDSKPQKARAGSAEKPKTTKPALKRAGSARDLRAPNQEVFKKPAIKPKLTMPMTPTFLKRKAPTSSTAITKSSEELEMERIKELRQELARKRKIAEDSLRVATTATGYVPIRSGHPLTKPDEFHFATDTRVKTHKMETRGDVDVQDFAAGLRKSTTSVNKDESYTQKDHEQHRVTVPQPFKLHDRKRKRQTEELPDGQVAPGGKFRSMAEEINMFSTKTPERFRSKAKKGSSPKTKRHEPKLTVPKTPNFETRTRARPVTAISHAELEEQEIEEQRNYQFKANPINDRIMRSQTGIKKVHPKELTKPVGFDLETERRGIERSTELEEEHYEFKANPVPTAILQGVTGVKPVMGAPVTIPESPAFALKNRVRPQKQASPELKMPERRSMRCNQALHTGVPFMPTLEHKVTEIKPFSFEEQTRLMAERKEQKRLQILEEERRAREFRANPLPENATHLPPKCTKPSTRIQPFNLEGDRRGAAKAEEWSQRMEEELQQQRVAASFKARPNSVVFKEPFIPKKSTKPLTGHNISDFELSTERRAEDRQEWEAYKAEKEQETAALRHAAEEQKRREEEEEVARMRQQAVHKAQPVRKFKPVHVKPSDKPVTLPCTPKFSDRIRHYREKND